MVVVRPCRPCPPRAALAALEPPALDPWPCRLGILLNVYAALCADAEEEEAGDGKMGKLNGEVLALDSQHPTPLTRLLKKTVAGLIKAHAAVMSDHVPGQSAPATGGQQDHDSDERYSDDDAHNEAASAAGDTSVEDWPGAQAQEGRTRVTPPPDSDDGDDHLVASDVE